MTKFIFREVMHNVAMGQRRYLIVKSKDNLGLDSKSKIKRRQRMTGQHAFKIYTK